MLAKLLTPLMNKLLGSVSALGALASVAGAGAWLLGPGRETVVTLNLLELSGLCAAAALVLEWARKSPPGGG